MEYVGERTKCSYHMQQSEIDSEGRHKKLYKIPIKPGNQIERNDSLDKIEGKKFTYAFWEII